MKIFCFLFKSGGLVLARIRIIFTIFGIFLMMSIYTSTLEKNDDIEFHENVKNFLVKMKSFTGKIAFLKNNSEGN